MRRNGIRRGAVLLAVSWIAAGLTACGSSGNGAGRGMDKAEVSVMSCTGSGGIFSYTEEGLDVQNAPAEDGIAPEAAEPDGADAEAAGQQETRGRKLVKTVDMSVETREFDRMLEQLQQQIDAMGGYVENMNTYNGSIYSGYRSSRSAGMTIRIPQDRLDEFLDAVSHISNVVSRNDRVDDITLTYVDLKSHKEALETEQARLLELLEQAQSVEDIITIEERLSNVRYQIESMESRLRTYDNQVDYSTVSLNIEEVKELTPVSQETAWERIASGFMGSLRGIGNGAKEIGIWLLINLPYLAILAAVIAAIVLILRKQMKRAEVKRRQNPGRHPNPYMQPFAAAEERKCGETPEESDQPRK